MAALGCLASPALAQWTSDTNQNTPIAIGAGEQNQSKIRTASDGSVYISWLSNPGGGYDTMLQRIDKDGVAQWAANGISVAEGTFSSTQDYGLAVDANDNAVVAYRDDRPGTVQIGVNKVAPDGTLLWGANGKIVSTSANGNSPRVTVLSDGSTVVGYSLNSSVFLQKLDADGNTLWTPPGIVITEATRNLSLSDLQPGDNGSVIALWVRCSGTICATSNKHLYVQKFNAAGAPLWNGDSPVILFNANSIQNGYFPTFESDGAGGGVFAWYENGGSRNSYVQHIDAAGNLLFPAPGAAVNTTANVIRLSNSGDYDPATGEIVATWSQSNSLQTQWGIYAQKFDATGARLWGDGGIEIKPLSANQPSFVWAVEWDGGVLMAAQELRTATTGVVLATLLDFTGAEVWGIPPLEACSLVSGKSRLFAATNGCDFVLAWGDSRVDTNNIYAQNIHRDGTFGPLVPLPGDLNCSGAADQFDVEPMVTALLDPNAYAAQFPCCSIAAGDMNEDLQIDGADIESFTFLLVEP